MLPLGALFVCSRCRAFFRSQFTSCPLDGEPLSLEPRDPLIGTTLDRRFEIVTLLTDGGTGRIYRGRAGKREAAIKVLFGEIAAEESCRRRFALETRLTASLRHPSIVEVLGHGHIGGLFFIASELVDGGSLRSFIEDRAPVPPGVALEIVRDLAAGLDYIHARNLVHRDLKPSNVLMTTEGRAKILDCGCAVDFETPPDDRITGEFRVPGSPGWMSPEQATCGPLDHRSDLFSLGLILYELLAGKPPFDGNMFERNRQNISGAFPIVAMRNKRARIPAAIESFMHRLLARDREQRPPSGAAVVEEIDRMRGA